MEHICLCPRPNSSFCHVWNEWRVVKSQNLDRKVMLFLMQYNEKKLKLFHKWLEISLRQLKERASVKRSLWNSPRGPVCLGSCQRRSLAVNPVCSAEVDCGKWTQKECWSTGCSTAHIYVTLLSTAAKEAKRRNTFKGGTFWNRERSGWSEGVGFRHQSVLSGLKIPSQGYSVHLFASFPFERNWTVLP